jgi:ABC-2 type transport system permease protein
VLFRSIAGLELKAAGRERLAIALLGVFLGMVLVSSGIGWATHHTVTIVFNETVRVTGQKLVNPFDRVSSLDSLKNTIIYIVLIGALLAIVAGTRSSIRDRKAGVASLIFSRPVAAWSYAAGKLIGVQVWLGLVLAAAAVLSWLSVWLVSGHILSLSATGSLLAFFGLALLFLVPFTAMGLLAGAYSHYESTALLVPILLWVAVTFVVPQLGTAEHPTALLNPVPSAVTASGVFFQFNRYMFQPIAITEHFKHAGSVLLGLAEAGSRGIGADLASIIIIGILAAALLVFVPRQVARRDLYE